MSSTKSLYVQFSPEEYKGGKSLDLQAQADSLKILKHIQNLKILSKQRQELRAKLAKLLEQVVRYTYSVEKKFPDPTVPKELRRKKPKIENQRKEPQVEEKVKRDYSKLNDIDLELVEIQRKLQMLNA